MADIRHNFSAAAYRSASSTSCTAVSSILRFTIGNGRVSSGYSRIRPGRWSCAAGTKMFTSIVSSASSSIPRQQLCARDFPFIGRPHVHSFVTKSHIHNYHVISTVSARLVTKANYTCRVHRRLFTTATSGSKGISQDTKKGSGTVSATGAHYHITNSSTTATAISCSYEQSASGPKSQTIMPTLSAISASPVVSYDIRKVGGRTTEFLYLHHPQDTRSNPAVTPSSPGTGRSEHVPSLTVEELEKPSSTAATYAPASLHVIVIPGNPGIAAYYDEYAMALHAALLASHSEAKMEVAGGVETQTPSCSNDTAAKIVHSTRVTVIGYAGHTEKPWDGGKLWSLAEQVEHKAEYVREVVEEAEQAGKKVRIVVVGHSIGAHMAVEMLRRFPESVVHAVGLYPFLQPNSRSVWQKVLAFSARLWPLCVLLSAFAHVLGKLPATISTWIVRILLGAGWREKAIQVTRKFLLQYSVVRNYSFMGMTEFDTLPKELDWAHFKANKKRISILFGVDDHWGPLHLRDEMERMVPEMETVVDPEGHPHAFCCTTPGSAWVAHETARLISKASVIPPPSSPAPSS